MVIEVYVKQEPTVLGVKKYENGFLHCKYCRHSKRLWNIFYILIIITSSRCLGARTQVCTILN